LKAGFLPSQINVGLAAFGRTWTLANTNSHNYNSPAIGAGNPGICTQESGFLASFEINNMIKTGGNMAIDSESQTAYAWKGNQFVTFDTIETHKKKTDYICSLDLGGIMWWSFDLE
jgi:chitinase